MSDKLPYPVVAIKAVDWSAFDDENLKVSEIGSCHLSGAWIVGFRVYEDDKKLMLAREYYIEDQQCCAVIVISKITIEKRINLK